MMRPWSIIAKASPSGCRSTTNAELPGSENNIGVVYKSQGLYQQALEWFQKSLKHFEAVNDKGSAAAAVNNMGDIYRRQGRYDLAREQFQQSLQSREEVGDQLGISRTLKNLGLLYHDQGNYGEMLEVSRRAAQLAEEVNAPEDLWQAQESIGRAWVALGQPVPARQSFLQAIATIEALRPSDRRRRAAAAKFPGKQTLPVARPHRPAGLATSIRRSPDLRRTLQGARAARCA